MTLFDRDKFMARLVDGYSLNAAITGKHAPHGKRVRGVGSREGFRGQCRKNPEWGREAMALIEKNNAAARKRCGQARTHCKRGHLLAGGNLAYKRDSKDGKIYRYCIACHNYRGLVGAAMKPEKVHQVRKAVEAGFNISEITRGSKAIVNFNTLKRYRIEHPEFDRLIIENARGALARSQLMLFRIVPTNAAFFSLTEPRPEIPPFEMQPGDYEWILSLISRRFPYDMRMDIAQDVLEALLRRAISREQVKGRIIDIVSKHRRAVGNPDYNDSLDAPLGPDGKFTRMDAVSFDHWKAGLG